MRKRKVIKQKLQKNRIYTRGIYENFILPHVNSEKNDIKDASRTVMFKI